MRNNRPLSVEVVRLELQARAWMSSTFPFVSGALWVPQRKLRSGGVSNAHGSSGRRESLYSLHSARRTVHSLSFPLRVALSAQLHTPYSL